MKSMLLCRMNLVRSQAGKASHLFRAVASLSTSPSPPDNFFSLVKQLREKTGGGVMECRNILEKHKWNFDAALSELSEKAKNTVGREGRSTGASRIGMAYGPAGGVLVQLASETDFVSKTEKFGEVMNGIAGSILPCAMRMGQGPAQATEMQVSEVEGMQYVAADSEEMSIAERIQSLQYATKENINLLKVQMISTEGVQSPVVEGYNHSGGRSAAIIVASGDSTASELLKQIAVHAATNNPTSLDGDPKPDFDRPDRLPHPLLHQPFLFDDSQTILQVSQKANLKIEGFLHMRNID